jgi:hypothetical protein
MSRKIMKSISETSKSTNSKMKYQLKQAKSISSNQKYPANSMKSHSSNNLPCRRVLSSTTPREIVRKRLGRGIKLITN